jgi:hypothetical protein
MIQVLQNAVYGIGSMAKVLNKEAFKSLLPGSMEAIDHVISMKDTDEEEFLVVKENAYITLGVLAFFHTQDAAHVKKFLELLPLKGEDEAQEAHELLLDQLLAKNSALVTPEMQPTV